MPSKSPAQHRLMAAVANNPAFAKKVGIPTAVGKEFARADKDKGFSTKAEINRPNTAHGKLDMPFHSVKSNAKGGEMKESKAMMKKEIAFMQKKGAPKSMIKHEKAEAKYAKGGGVFRRAADGIAQRGKTKGKMLRKGGKVC